MSLSDSLFDSACFLEEGKLSKAHAYLVSDLANYSVEPWDYIPEHLAAVQAIVEELAALLSFPFEGPSEICRIVEKMKSLRLLIEGFGRADGKGYDGWFRTGAKAPSRGN